MRKKTENGLTVIELLIALAIVALLAGIALSILVRVNDTRRAAENKFNQLQTVLTYGLAGGLQPVPLQDGWYYFRETTGSNITLAIMSFELTSGAKSNQLALVTVCRAGRSDATTKNVDKQLAKLADRAGLTNGYFVLFEEMEAVKKPWETTTEAQSRQQADKLRLDK